MRYSKSDYPLAEKHADKIKGRRGKALSDVTLDAVMSGDATIEDLRITPQALLNQSEISHSANRPRLADNFARAAELVEVPQNIVMQTYELLRPGRAKDKAELMAAAANLRKTYGAERIAAFIEEAANVYEQRGLFSKRF
jgi:glycerol dehydratase small subunit/propanediol dehydratase small subunit